MTSPPAQKAAFQEWARSNVGQPDFSGKHIRGGAWAYNHNIMQQMWECWQSAITEAVDAADKRVKELEAALAHIDACCYGSEMLDWTSQLNVTKNLVNIHTEATAALEAPHEP